MARHIVAAECDHTPADGGSERGATGAPDLRSPSSRGPCQRLARKTPSSALPDVCPPPEVTSPTETIVADTDTWSPVRVSG